MSGIENKTQDNSKKITFGDFDKLNLKPFAENLMENIENGLKSNIGPKGSYTISLDAEFGNGKTTFLEMSENYAKDEKLEYNVLFINAWESDFYGEPIISILHNFINLIEKTTLDISSEDKEGTDRKQSNKKDIMDRTLKILGNMTNQVIENKTGLNIKKTIELCCNKNNDSKKYNQEDEIIKGQAILAELNQRKDIIKEIKETISEYIKDKKLLIIVDELDRARPDYAVKFLEDMKHFFDIENVVFLVAVNRKQIEATIKCLFGQDLDFNGYYRKFFKQEIELPDPYEEAQKFIHDRIQEADIKLAQKDKDKSSHDHRSYNIYLSCKMFGLTLREIEQFLNIFSTILKDELDNTTHSKYTYSSFWCYIDCYSFFICLYLKKKDSLNSIFDRNLELGELHKFIEENSLNRNVFDENEEHYTQHLLALVALSCINKTQDKINLEEICNTLTKLLPRVSNEHIKAIMDDIQYTPLQASMICEKIKKHEAHSKQSNKLL